MRITRFLAGALAVTAASLALAQTPAPASTAPDASSIPSFPPSGCVAPDIPSRVATEAQVKLFNRDYKAYAECIKKYVDDAKKYVQDIKTRADAAIAAGNKAADDYNKYVETVRKEFGEGTAK